MKILLLAALLASLTIACGDEERAPTFPGTIAKEVESEEVNGIQVYVVSEEDPDGVAEECVDFYLEEYGAVSCYVFESQVAFEAAGTSDEYGKAMQQLCWASYRSVSPQASNGSDTNKKFNPRRCS
ncbi:MAG: hypothetical protein ACRDKT_17080 [Actinomycetota bacterium]